MENNVGKLTASVAERTELADFLTEFRTTNMSLDTAKEKLMAIVAKVDANAEGSVTAFYTGKVNGIRTADIITELKAKGASIRYIGDTEAAKFVDGDIFEDALREVFGIMDEADDFDDWNSPVNQWLNDPDHEKGPWAKVSKEPFAKLFFQMP
jgi:hypothetical protein